MQEKVEAYLERQREKELARRKKTLMKLGICRRIYMPEDARPTADMVREYPYEDEGRRFRVEPVAVTDEEWAAIRSAKGEERRRRNPVCRALWYLGIAVYALGLLLGLLAFYGMTVQGQYGTALLQMLGRWFFAGLLGTLVLGQSEIIRLLDRK